MPAGRARPALSSPPTPARRRLQPGPAASCRAGRGWPAASSRAPGPTECGQPGRGLFSAGRGAAPASVFFGFFLPLWPASPLRPPAQCGRGGHVAGEVGGKGGPPRSGLGLGPRPRPGGPAAVRSALLGRGRAAGLLIARLAPAAAAAPRRPLPARPSSGEHGWPGHSLPSDGLRALLMAAGYAPVANHWPRFPYL